MKVLVGCECSGRVRDAFLRRGHDAYSCDLKPDEMGQHRRHIQKDIMVTLCYRRDNWDIIILHLDCTYMAVSGNRWYGRGTQGHQRRIDAIKWSSAVWTMAKRAAKVGCAFENPVSVIWKHIDYDTLQYVQPWQFGHGETKKTGLALDRLPKLTPTKIVEGREQRVWKMAPSETRKADRARTYHGIADAFAEQWGNIEC